MQSTTQMTFLPSNENYMVRDASLSPCGLYRYSLSRCWDRSATRPWLGWIMLNPSTADALLDDPTIRRCIEFSRALGYGGLTIRNLFTLRATDPNVLAWVADPIGPGADELILEMLAGGTEVVAAWGNGGGLFNRDACVLKLIRKSGFRLQCLGKTKAGFPCHPLRLPGNRPLEFFE